MKRNIRYIALAASLAVLSTSTIQAADQELRAEAREAVTNFLKADSTLKRFFTESAGYAIFPSVGKGGFVVGAARGRGVVLQKTNIIGEAVMTQASFGAQAGAQKFAQIIFFENLAALNDFRSGKFEMSAEISAVIVTEGASKAADYKKGVAVFTQAEKGLMVQASIGGQKFKFEPEPLPPTGGPGSGSSTNK